MSYEDEATSTHYASPATTTLDACTASGGFQAGHTDV